MLRGIKAPISIVMEQCYSGSFVHPVETLNQIITIATAAHKNEPSNGHFYRNPFAYKVACAYAGYDPETGTNVNADSDSDGQHTLLEAFNHARYVESDDTAQYWSYGGIEYGASTVDVFQEKSNYMNNVGQLGNYQSTDATLGCDYSSLNNGAPTKNISITETLNSATKSYNAGSKINVKATINYSQITLTASDKITIQKGTLITSSKFKGTTTRCGELRSFENPEDVVTLKPESKKIKDVEYINMSDFAIENHVYVSPNPTDGEFTIYFGEESDGDNSLVITDLTGKIVYQAEALGNEVSINLGDKSKGIYIVKSISNGNLFSEKLILK